MIIENLAVVLSLACVADVFTWLHSILVPFILPKSKLTSNPVCFLLQECNS
jgi:hypothetical protein